MATITRASTKTTREITKPNREDLLKLRGELRQSSDAESFIGGFSGLEQKHREAIVGALRFALQLFQELPSGEALELLEQATAKCADEALVGIPLPTIRISGKEYRITYERPLGGWQAIIFMYLRGEFHSGLSCDPNDEDVVLLSRRFASLHVISRTHNHEEGGSLEQSGYFDLKTGAFHVHTK
jgi:hypothetical protein